MRTLGLYTILILALSAGGAFVYQQVRPDASDQRLGRLRQLTLPPAGKARYAFLMRNIPDVVSQVTCSCCGRRLTECYQGACPPQCGPCNEQGQIAYNQFVHGRSIADIQRYMAKNHPVLAGAPGL